MADTAPTAAQRVYAHVKEGVLSGAFADGTMLSEGQIADALGVSRTPVREAFLHLESQGLLKLYPKRGALVVPVTREEVDAVMQTRWVVERFGLERAVEHGDASVVNDMRAALATQRTLLDAGDLPAFVDADREFHRVAVAATTNAILIDLYDSIRERQRRMIRRRLDTNREAAHALDQHTTLTNALEAGDQKHLLALLKTHISETREALLGV
ncbi:MAG: GntR family transcriptional regulator [Solirubrobacteraceae bacterium]